MSAYICDFYHISVLAVAIYQRVGISDTYQPSQIATLLHAENTKSVKFRYSDVAEPFQVEPEPFTFDRWALRYTARHSTVELIKAAHCFEYQACQHPGWEQSLARNWIDRLLNQLTRELPGYQDAAWGVEQPRARSVNASGVIAP